MADIFERILLLKNTDVFEHVDTDDLRNVAQELDEQNLSKGDQVFAIDELGDRMYLILSGRVGISLHEEAIDDEKKYIAILESGDCFGEMGLLDDKPRSASAHALEDSRVLILGKQRLHGLLGHYPQLAIGILRSLSLRLRSMNERSEN